MRVLVTGARGFIGRHLTPYLVARGWEVHAVSSARGDDSRDITWHHADLLDGRQRDALIDAVRPETLVHLAWCTGSPDFWSDPANARWLAATLELAHAFRERGGRRLLGAGSCAEYRWSAEACHERTTPLIPRTLYGAAKAACGTMLDALAERGGMSVAWARIFYLLGPHELPRRLLPSLVRELSAGRPARCLTGHHARDFLHVEDAAQALMALLEADVTGPVNIGSGVARRVEEIARRIASALDAEALLTVEPGPAEDAFVLADVTRLREEVGWDPPADVLPRVDEAVSWWRSALNAEAQ